MKKIKHIKICHAIFRTFVCLLLLLITFTAISCTEEPDISDGGDKSDDLHTTNVVRDINGFGILEYGDYVYCTRDKIYRYNRKNG